MKAKNITGQAPGGKRIRLADTLPLDTPYVIQIFPVYACNFKCGYCIFSVKKEKRHFISDKISMDLDIFKKCVDDMDRFPSKIKVLRFVGIGEPLLHKKIVKMIMYASQKQVANTIEVLTNASMLTNEMSDLLIAAGINRLVVSLQGTTAKKYYEVSKFKLDMDDFLKNLKYFYKNKGEAKVYIKIVDTALDDSDDEKNFFDIFGNLCDTMAVEQTVPIHTGIDYDNLMKNKKLNLTQFGFPVKGVKICPQPFFHMQINPDGKVVPCYSFEYPKILGDCNIDTLNDIWNGETFKTFRLKMLTGIENVCDICMGCNMIKYRLFPEDDLIADSDRLIKIYMEG